MNCPLAGNMAIADVLANNRAVLAFARWNHKEAESAQAEADALLKPPNRGCNEGW
jgi:hypothetical protein